ncbi:MAG: hypothetical protein GXZ07_04540 [Firmicutes bacterium]|nr:hypothetical protein [Bacillota bacterium]
MLSRKDWLALCRPFLYYPGIFQKSSIRAEDKIENGDILVVVKQLKVYYNEITEEG